MEDTCPVEAGSVKQVRPCQDCKEMLPSENYGAHPTHCCVRHGCKYGNEDCPVSAGKVVQEYPCYYCVDVKEAEQEVADLLEEIAFAKAIKGNAKKAEETRKSRIAYMVRGTTRSERVLNELLEKHKDDPRHDCDQCDRNLFIANSTNGSPFYGDAPYRTNSVNTVEYQSDAFESEIRGDDSKHWICKECQRNNLNEI